MYSPVGGGSSRSSLATLRLNNQTPAGFIELASPEANAAAACAVNKCNNRAGESAALHVSGGIAPEGVATLSNNLQKVLPSNVAPSAPAPGAIAVTQILAALPRGLALRGTGGFTGQPDVVAAAAVLCAAAGSGAEFLAGSAGKLVSGEAGAAADVKRALLFIKGAVPSVNMASRLFDEILLGLAQRYNIAPRTLRAVQHLLVKGGQLTYSGRRLRKMDE